MSETSAPVIVCPDDADTVLRFAADELGRYLNHACGVRPRIVIIPYPERPHV